LPLMQWTTVRLVVSETMGAVTTGNKTPQGEGSVSALRTRRRNKGLGPEEDRTLKQWAECRDKNGAVLSRWGGFFS